MNLKRALEFGAFHRTTEMQVNLPLILLSMSWSAALFRSFHHLLPPAVRVASIGFVMLALGFLASGLFRYCVLGSVPMVTQILIQGFGLTVLLTIAVSGYASEVALYLATAIGVNLLWTPLALLGVGQGVDGFGLVSLAWEIGASLVAIVRMRSSRPYSYPVRVM